jgi:putative transposase
MRDRYKIVDPSGVYFMTSTIVEWIPVFNHNRYFNIIIESMKFCIQNKGLELYSFVIMDNHVHWIASGPELSQTMLSLKKFSANQIIKQLQSDGKDWVLNQFVFF